VGLGGLGGLGKMEMEDLGLWGGQGGFLGGY
jgi:hypothetical protein